MDHNTTLYLLYSTIAIFVAWSLWYGLKPYRRTKEFPYKEAKSSFLQKHDLRFVANGEFCSKCLTHDYFWTGGGATAPDRCPWHNKDDGDVVLWKHMNLIQRNQAARKFKEMWYQKHGTVYRFTRYDD